MFDDVKLIADQVGWPIAMMFALIILGDRMGMLSIKKNKDSDRLDQLIVVVTELGLKVARVEAILEERRK